MEMATCHGRARGYSLPLHRMSSSSSSSSSSSPLRPRARRPLPPNQREAPATAPESTPPSCSPLALGCRRLEIHPDVLGCAAPPDGAACTNPS
ncbi:hypothetical protein ACP4OV_012008 [Aristida adscensionis]